MSDYSRVRKYKQLREDINNDMGETKDIGSALKAYNNAINKQEESKPTLSHEKTYELPKSDVEINESKSTFKNEYLDSFIQEVREYNLQKGIRENEDTKLDILHQLTNKNREKRANYIEKVVDETPVAPQEEPSKVLDIKEEVEEETAIAEQTLEISRQVFEMINEEEEVAEEVPETTVEETVEVTMNETEEEESDIESIIDSMETVEIPVMEEKEEVIEKVEVATELEKRIAALEETMSFSKEDKEKEELIEETKQLKVQTENLKQEIDTMNENVSSNNRLLNVIITVLLIALLAVIGVVIYWLFKGGIINV